MKNKTRPLKYAGLVVMFCLGVVLSQPGTTLYPSPISTQSPVEEDNESASHRETHSNGYIGQTDDYAAVERRVKRRVLSR